MNRLNKLSKFRGLLVNEYVKILNQISTKIMLIVIILTAAGFNALMHFVDTQTHHHSTFGNTVADVISDLQRHQPEGWERLVEMYTYMDQLNIPPFAIHRDPSGWRSHAAQLLFNVKWITEDGFFDDDAQLYRSVQTNITDALDRAIRSNDFIMYTRVQLDWYTLRPENPFDYNIQLPAALISASEIDIWSFNQVIEHNATPGTWQLDVIEQIAQAKFRIAHEEMMGDDIESEVTAAAREIILLGEYRLTHGIRSYTYDGIENATMISGGLVSGGSRFWDVFASTVFSIGLLSVLMIVVAGRILSSEFSAGTVKFLLINPAKRWKIFMAKYVTVLSLGLAMLAALYISNLIFAGIFFGFSDIGVPHLSVVDGTIVRSSSILYVASRYLLGAVSMLCMATFAFAVSSIVRSSALAIGLGVCLYFAGSIAVNILSAFGFYWARYILFANTDILAVINGTTGFVNHTLVFALINIAAYMAVFILTAWDGFVRAEIK